jgi:hypothetical protein
MSYNCASPERTNLTRWKWKMHVRQGPLLSTISSNLLKLVIVSKLDPLIWTLIGDVDSRPSLFLSLYKEFAEFLFF